MAIRIRTILVIFLTTLFIVSFSVFVGVFTARSGIETSQESDLMLISEIADYFISSEIKSLKLKAAGAAQLLSLSDEIYWVSELSEINDRYPEFSGITVWDAERKLRASAGNSPIFFDVMDDAGISRAYGGAESILTAVSARDGFLFFITAPISGAADSILVLTLPGTYFSELLSTFVIWDTGHVFMDDAQGRLIADPIREWVEERIDFVDLSVIEPRYEEALKSVRQGLSSDAAVLRYSISERPRLCIYRPVRGSEEGWLMGAVAPLMESPFRHIDYGLVTVGIVSLLLGLIAAVIASGFIKKPFEAIAALKEEAEANSRFKSDFLANMSHEIRTPMNTILGVAEILVRDEAVSPGVSEGLDTIHNSGSLLLGIINDILDLSKIEAGKLELIPTEYETASLINDTITLNMMRVGSKELDFKLSVDENLPHLLYGDDIRIKQILNNLLSNAFKYTANGEVKLSFSAIADKIEKDAEITLVISVSDTGQGMTAEQVSGLFEKYMRYNFNANRTIEGTGLGMNITNNLVKLFSGDISIVSEPGVGSVFTVRIPQVCADSGVLGKELTENLESFRTGGIRQMKKANIVYEPMPYGKVLIVDDVESNLYVAKGLMLPYELQTDSVTSGFAAINRIKKGEVYDIVFMDHMMPKMDGVEAAKIIRELGYAHPIVALTANALKGQREMFLENGFDDFVSKPIDVRRLNAVLKKFVRDIQPQDVIDEIRSRTRADKETGDADGLDGNALEYGTDSNKPEVMPQLAEVFMRDARSAVTVLETLQAKAGDYEDAEIGAYTTSVHAMKSALANVGEHILSAFAFKLEQAGRSRDVAVIRNETPAFLSKLCEVTERFQTFTAEDDDTDKAAGDLSALRDSLRVIKAACEDYDRKTIKDTIAELQEHKWDTQTAELLREMSAYLLTGDFEEIAKLT